MGVRQGNGGACDMKCKVAGSFMEIADLVAPEHAGGLPCETILVQVLVGETVDLKHPGTSHPPCSELWH